MSEWDFRGKVAGSFLPPVPQGGGISVQLPRPGVTDIFPIRWLWRGNSRGFKRAAGGRPLCATTWSKAGGNYATQRAAGAAPGMLGGCVPADPPRLARPPPQHCPRAPALLRRLSGSRSAGRGVGGGVLVAEVGGASAGPLHFLSLLVGSPFKSPSWLLACFRPSSYAGGLPPPKYLAGFVHLPALQESSV